jgi:hypothetical protein
MLIFSKRKSVVLYLAGPPTSGSGGNRYIVGRYVVSMENGACVQISNSMLVYTSLIICNKDIYSQNEC